MNKFGILAIAFGLAISIVACGPAPILPAAPIPTLPPLPSLVPPASLTPVATSSPASTSTSIGATVSPSPISTGAVTQTVAARASVTPTLTLTTRAAATTAPTSPAAGFPPGVYITDLKVEPNPPTRSADLIFSPTFVNSTSAAQNYRWIVYIYKTDNPSRSTGETPPAQSAIPVGTTEQRAGGTWKYGPGSQCDFFFVRIGSLDLDKKINLFSRPDGKVFEKSLTLCP